MKIKERLFKVITSKKNVTPHFKEHCTKTDESALIVIRFFFFQPNIVFKSNPVFIDILFTFLPFCYWSSRDFEVHPVPLHLFYKNQWSFDEVQCSFFKVFSFKIFVSCLIWVYQIKSLECPSAWVLFKWPSAQVPKCPSSA